MTQAATDDAFRVSQAAAERIAEIIAAEPEAKMLRVSVEGGGCTGFQYKFDLVPRTDKADDDIIIEKAGAEVVIDAVSLPFVAGSELDFVDALIGASFRVNNPNAVAACGCGTSFSV
ncbi:MAG: iron-sulfur cluster assembly accessory protein [Pseudomonadota bacterium]